MHFEIVALMQFLFRNFCLKHDVNALPRIDKCFCADTQCVLPEQTVTKQVLSCYTCDREQRYK